MKSRKTKEDATQRSTAILEREAAEVGEGEGFMPWFVLLSSHEDRGLGVLTFPSVV